MIDISPIKCPDRTDELLKSVQPWISLKVFQPQPFWKISIMLMLDGCAFDFRVQQWHIFPKHNKTEFHTLRPFGLNIWQSKKGECHILFMLRETSKCRIGFSFVYVKTENLISEIHYVRTSLLNTLVSQTYYARATLLRSPASVCFRVKTNTKTNRFFNMPGQTFSKNACGYYYLCCYKTNKLFFAETTCPHIINFRHSIFWSCPNTLRFRR